MTRPSSEAFKRKMIQRLTGKEAVSALQGLVIRLFATRTAVLIPGPN